jgi:hypothetical protein
LKKHPKYLRKPQKRKKCKFKEDEQVKHEFHLWVTSPNPVMNLQANLNNNKALDGEKINQRSTPLIYPLSQPKALTTRQGDGCSDQPLPYI